MSTRISIITGHLSRQMNAVRLTLRRSDGLDFAGHFSERPLM